MKTVRGRGARRPLAGLLACLIGVVGVVIGGPEARAAEIAAIDTSSIALTRMNPEDDAVYKWSNLRVDAAWSLPDGTGHAGDTFRLTLPQELGGAEGNFDLRGREGDPLAYGSCAVTTTEVVCTLNSNVEGKNDAGGSLWVKTQVRALTTSDKLAFATNNGVTVDVPLPEGGQGIGYKPYVPGDIDNSGWFPGTDQTAVYWRIVIPGSAISDRSSVTITDNYAHESVNLTVAEGFPKVFSIPSTPECWNELTSTECRNDMDASTVPSSEVSVDDTADQVKATIDNKGKKFRSDRIYVFDLQVKADGDIPVGSQYTNKATVAGDTRTARAEKTPSGGGVEIGDTVGHISVRKVTTRTVVDPATVYPVTWSYQDKGNIRSGELSLRGDGTVETLTNIPNGTVVTFTEKLPSISGARFGDPVYSGGGVADGVPDANSAQVTAEGLTTLQVTLTNPVIPDPFKPGLPATGS